MFVGEGGCAFAGESTLPVEFILVEESIFMADDTLSKCGPSTPIDSCSVRDPSFHSLIDLNETIADTAGFAMPPKRKGVVNAESIGVP